MTTFKCASFECDSQWTEGPTRDYCETELCRKCLQAILDEKPGSLPEKSYWFTKQGRTEAKNLWKNPDTDIVRIYLDKIEDLESRIETLLSQHPYDCIVLSNLPEGLKERILMTITWHSRVHKILGKE